MSEEEIEAAATKHAVDLAAVEAKIKADKIKPDKKPKKIKTWGSGWGGVRQTHSSPIPPEKP